MKPFNYTRYLSITAIIILSLTFTGIAIDIWYSVEQQTSVLFGVSTTLTAFYFSVMTVMTGFCLLLVLLISSNDHGYSSR